MDESESRVPQYVQVAETLRRRIVTDEYVEGSLIPPAQELERSFGVSNITIRKALEVLSREGMIARKRGVGTIVRKCERDLVVFEFGGDFKRLVKSTDSLPVEIEVLDMVLITAPFHVQQAMALDSGETVLCVTKIRKHNGSPLSFYYHYVDRSLFTKIGKKDLEQKTFVDLFQEVSGLKLVSMEQKLESVTADVGLAKVLQVNFGAPLFFVENLYFTTGHKPAILTQIYYRGDKCSYKATTEL